MWPTGVLWGSWWFPQEHRSVGGDLPPRVALGVLDRAHAAVRHPSFSPVAARRLTATLTWRDLGTMWQSTDRWLDEDASVDVRHACVVLRAALLDEMQARRPAAFEAWYARLL